MARTLESESEAESEGECRDVVATADERRARDAGPAVLRRRCRRASRSGGTACTAETTAALDPGECETVECTWSDPPSEDVDVTAVVDDAGDGDGENTECHEGNNETSFPGVSCEGPG